MISTSVKDVGSVMNAITPSSSTSNSSSGSNVSFQSVLDNQTNKESVGQPKADNNTKVEDKEPVDACDNTKVEKDTKSADVDDTSEAEDVAKATDAQGMTEEVDEEVLEILGGAAYELMQQIAEVLGVSVEEVQSTMEMLGMNDVELLNPDKLSDLILTISGSNDSLSLLTNEELYTDYQQIMEQLKGLLQKCEEALEMNPEQLNKLIDDVAIQQATMDAVEEMPIEEMDIPEVPQDDASDTVYIHKVTEADIYNNAGTVTVEVTEPKQDAGQSTESNARQENPFAQNLLNQQPQMVQELENLAQTSTSWDADTEQIMRQIMDYMKIHVGPEATDIEMRLTPESLGTLHVQVASKSGVLTANFMAENETVKAVLESQMVQLKESFAEQGVKVEAIEVTVQTHEFERNLEQGRGRQQEETNNKKNKTRRINLNAPLDTELVEEEDKLAAEMMAANGSTVDYTV